MKIKHHILLILLFISFSVFADGDKHLTAKVKQGKGAYSLFKKYNLKTSECNLNYFKEINSLNENLTLIANKLYKLPVLVYTYNTKSIRSTIGVDDLALAKKIQAYNESLHQAGLRKKDYREDNVLWVPYDLLNCGSENIPKSNTTINYPIFGKEYEDVEIKDSKLKGHVYYVVAGHGGPDPGAMGEYEGHTLCEDEYAYDISLRLAKNLLEHNATVYMITRDLNDGIRSEAFLKPDKDEVCYKNKEMPLNQIKRLNQRVDAINQLYNKHKKQRAKKQRAIIIHVDSRSNKQRLDMFFYHNPKSKNGKALAITIRNTIRDKYAEHQKGRGYSGTVKSRNLHMLRETYPVAVYAELGNIRNYKDQKRFIIEDNRQAVANWLCEGLMNE